MRERRAFAYLITHTDTGRQYVGIGLDPRRRWYDHRCAARTNSRSQFLLQRAMAKYGVDAFTFEVIACARTWEDALATEITLITQYGTFKPAGFNMTLGGQGTTGRKLSDAAREKIAAAKRGHAVSEEQRRRQAESMRGKKMPASHVEKGRARVVSTETRARLSAAGKGKPKTKGMTGRKHSPETIEKMRQKATGRKHSPETIAKYSEQRRGKPLSEAHRAAILAGKAKAALLAGK